VFLLQVFFKTQIYTDLRRFQVAAVWIQKYRGKFYEWLLKEEKNHI